MALTDIKRGDRVLSLCCGTGLDAFIAATMVGDGGGVVGVDVSEGMLAVSQEKKICDRELGSRCQFLLHDVTRLDALPTLEKGSFDWLVCSNAFVLFEDPAKVVRSWREYVKPTGRLIVDITHEHNLRSGSLMERVARRMGVGFPANRSWIKTENSFRNILEAEGFVVEECVLLDKVEGERATYYDIEDADAQFDYITKTALTAAITTEEFKRAARAVFREEWAREAVDGKVEIVDALYVYTARGS